MGKFAVRIHNTRTFRIVGGAAVHAAADVTLRLGRATVRGTIWLRGVDRGTLEFSTWILSDELEAALAPCYAISEDAGNDVSLTAFEAACNALTG